MKTRLSILAFFASCSIVVAQTYTFSTFSEAYTPISNGSPAVSESWDDPELFIPLGFETIIYGETASALASSDFFLGGIVASNNNIESLNLIIATTADLIDPNYFNGNELTSPITYLTEGEPGDRICKVQWENAGFYDDVAEGSGGNLINLQLWVYENGRIEMRYGPNSIKEPDGILANGLSAGLMSGLDLFSEDFLFDEALLVSGNPSDPTLNQVNDVFQLFTTTLTGIPSSGRVYRFDPEESVSIREINAVEFNVWPLSTMTDVQVSVSHPGVSRYEIRDLSGKLIAEQQFSELCRVPLSAQTTGLYLLTVYAENTFKTFKIVKY